MDKQHFSIEKAIPEDISLILNFIKSLAHYEKLSDDVSASEELIFKALFGAKPYAECIIGYFGDKPVAFAVYFFNFSTFLAKPGLYLEDLFVEPEFRGRGFGKAMLIWLARTAIDSGCGRFEWSVLDWNEPAINFYKSLGAMPMDEWTVFRMDEQAISKLASSE
jgi:GNAT superfamily N-acetyltransferase